MPNNQGRLPNLVREHFTRAGKPKKQFGTVEEAHKFRATERRAAAKRVYLCTICGKYHLGGNR